MPDDTQTKLANAADDLWNKPMDEEVAGAVRACEKSAKVCMILLDTCPVTQAMQFAIAYGWMLREKAINKERKLIT